MRKNRVISKIVQKNKPLLCLLLCPYFPNYLIEFFIFIYEFDPGLSEI